MDSIAFKLLTAWGRLRWTPVSLLVGVALAAAACSSSSLPSASPSAPGASATTATPTAAAVVIATGHTSFGTFLTATDGRTVYLFEKDKSSRSTCYGPCAAAWPPVTVSSTPTTSGGASGRLLGTSPRKDGTMQVTYAGHPLYFYSVDTASGQTNGEAVDAFGAEWYVVSPMGDKIEND